MKSIIRRIFFSIMGIFALKQSPIFASSIQDSTLITGTMNMLNDLANAVKIIDPILAGALILWFLARKKLDSENDARRWDNRIKITLICCILVFATSNLISLIIKYYQ